MLILHEFLRLSLLTNDACHVNNNMRLIKATNIIFTLVLSTLSFAHCCSSFNGWRANSKRVHNDNRIANTSPAPRLVDQRDEPCRDGLEETLCLNGGRCIMRIEPICVCAKGWSGPQCMQKTPDEYYNVKAARNGTRESTTVGASMEATTPRDPSPAFIPELIEVRTLDCPSPYDEIFCLNEGRCLLLGYGMPMMCECEYPFTGVRCEEKSLDGVYTVLRRPTRDVSC